MEVEMAMEAQKPETVPVLGQELLKLLAVRVKTAGHRRLMADRMKKQMLPLKKRPAQRQMYREQQQKRSL